MMLIELLAHSKSPRLLRNWNSLQSKFSGLSFCVSFFFLILFSLAPSSPSSPGGTDCGEVFDLPWTKGKVEGALWASQQPLREGRKALYVRDGKERSLDEAYARTFFRDVVGALVDAHREAVRSS